MKLQLVNGRPSERDTLGMKLITAARSGDKAEIVRIATKCGYELDEGLTAPRLLDQLCARVQGVLFDMPEGMSREDEPAPEVVEAVAESFEQE